MGSKYGVIVCPKCGMARGVETSKKTTGCQCGKEIDLSHVKIKYQTDSPLELADLVAGANAALRGGEPAPPERRSRKKDPYLSIAERAKPIKDSLERMRSVAQGLTELQSRFTIDDIRRVESLLGKDSAEDVLARLKEHNLVYESEPGVYRSV
jgi:hypothetical protein